MSKSKNNGVDPQDLIERYGADTARLYVMFASPPEDTLVWSDASIEGASRFLRRLWSLCVERKNRPDDVFVFGTDLKAAFSDAGKDVKALRFAIHSTLSQIVFDFERCQYNTVVSGAMKMLNTLEAFKPHIAVQHGSGDEPFMNVRSAAFIEGLGILLRVLHPVTPHIAHALWKDLGYATQYGDLVTAPWPIVDKAALEQDEIELVLQVNGKLRGHMRAPKSAGRDELEQLALAHDSVTRYTSGQTVKKVVVVPGRLVNVVL
jgi:leucyl-tRNA synthetase